MTLMPRTLSCMTITLAIAAACLFSAPARASDEPSPEARAHFEAGVALLQDPDGARYEEAYREFRAAYAASRSPRVLGNIGFCAMKLERDLEAIEAYSRYLESVNDIDPAEREQIQRDLATLRSGVVRVTIIVRPAKATIVDVRQPSRGEPISNVYLAEDGRVTLGLRPGHHIIRATDSGRASPLWELEASPGSHAEHVLEVAPPAPPPILVSTPPPEKPSRAAPIATIGFGAAVLAAGGVTGYLALRRVDAIAAECPNDQCPTGYDLEGAQRRARTLTTVTDGLLIGGASLTVIGVGWFLLSGSSSRERDRDRSRASAGCTSAGCLATWEGRF